MCVFSAFYVERPNAALVLKCERMKRKIIEKV
jgi:hypothetical protein